MTYTLTLSKFIYLLMIGFKYLVIKISFKNFAKMNINIFFLLWKAFLHIHAFRNCRNYRNQFFLRKMSHFFPKLLLSRHSFFFPHGTFGECESQSRKCARRYMRAPIILHRRRLVRRLRRSIFKHPRPAVRVRVVSRSRKRSWRKSRESFFPLLSSHLTDLRSCEFFR